MCEIVRFRALLRFAAETRGRDKCQNLAQRFAREHP